MFEIGSEFDWDSNIKFTQSECPSSFLKDAYYYRSGRDALRAIAKKHRQSNSRILLPTLCCESMVLPFRQFDYRVDYYQLNQDLSANIKDVFSKVDSCNILLYMDYFGIQSLSDEQLTQITRINPNIILIKDITHNFFKKKIDCEIPHYCVLSIRKWLAVPDGGLLFSKDQQDVSEKIRDTFFGDSRKQALQMKSEFLKTHNETLKVLYRDLLGEATRFIDNSDEIADISLESKSIINIIDFCAVMTVRKSNASLLHAELSMIRSVDEIKVLDLSTPLIYYPIILKNRDIMQKELSKIGIFCPVIWPLPKGAENRCSISSFISEHMLAIPCDQRYDAIDMHNIAQSILRISGGLI